MGGGMGKVQFTTKHRIIGPHTEMTMIQVYIPPAYFDAVLDLSEKADTKAGGYLSITLELPKRPRSTGPESQNNRANGFIRQIANATGNGFAEVEAACKLAALDEGYPVVKACGQYVAKSQSELTVEECAKFIATIERIAAEMGIHLEED